MKNPDPSEILSSGSDLSGGGGGAPNLRVGASEDRRWLSSAGAVSATLTRTPTTAGFTRSMTSAKPIGAGEPMASTSAARAAPTDRAITQAKRQSARTRAFRFAAPAKPELLFSTIGLFRSVHFRTSSQTGHRASPARVQPAAARSLRTRAEPVIAGLDPDQA